MGTSGVPKGGFCVNMTRWSYINIHTALQFCFIRLIIGQVVARWQLALTVMRAAAPGGVAGMLQEDMAAHRVESHVLTCETFRYNVIITLGDARIAVPVHEHRRRTILR